MPNFQPRGKFQTHLYSVLTMSLRELKTQRTKRWPSFILTVLGTSIESPDELKLRQREPSLPKKLTSKSTQKPLSVTYQHCNYVRNFFDQITFSADLQVPLPTNFLQFLSLKTPSEDALLLQIQNEHLWSPAELLFLINLKSCLNFQRRHNLRL